ncbi:MAG TPA: serine hydrolase [Terriglobales bacterium]|nr:serine hydrolase [Terriglobales bacterium]
MSCGLLLAQTASRADLERRIERVENGLLPAVEIQGQNTKPKNLGERMAHFKVPGVSIALIHGGTIEWARGFGVMRVAGQAVSTGTLFQAASISKPVTSVGALALVQSGKLSLDQNVNRWLKSWKVPENEFTREKPVTLRELLSHSAGITVHGFPGYASGRAVPSLLQVLKGEKPANTAAVAVEFTPGSQWSYSGGGFEVVQQLIADVTSEPFPEFMQKAILSPLHMDNSTFQQPLNDTLGVNAATPYRATGEPVEGGAHTYPEMSAAGLWTTPSDLAGFAISLQKSAAGQWNPILTKQMTQQMLTVQIKDWGLGVQLAGSGTSARFQHAGGNEGFRCFLVAYINTGDGAVVMTNSDTGDRLAKEVVRSIAHEYHWPDFHPVQRSLVPVDTHILESYVGRYEIDPDTNMTITVANGRLFGQITDDVKTELFSSSATTYFATDDDFEVSFLEDSKRRFNKAEIKAYGLQLVGHRVRTN